jgi:natural product biosynthesis luciferase-like monooxygenase protein
MALSLPTDSTAELVAVFTAWLGRLTERDAVTLGWVDRSFDLSGWETVIARQVPLELSLAGTAGFAALAERAQKELEQLARRKSHPRDLVARTPGIKAPVFEVGIEVGKGRAHLRGRTLCLVRDDEGVALLYDGASYDEASVRAMASQLASLLEVARAEPDRPADRLPMVSADERRQLLETFNTTKVALPETRVIHRLVEEQARRTPDASAVVFESKRLTYAELEARANRLAHRLLALGLPAESPVGVYLPRTEELVVAVLGVLKAGLAYLPLDPTYPKDRITLMVEDSGARAAVTTRAHAAELPAGVNAVCLDDAAAFAGLSDQPPSVDVKPESLAYVIYTSGSTGRPKGVMVEHGNVANFFVGMDARIPRGERASWLAVTSLSFDISVLELLWTLSRGVEVVIASESRAVSSESQSDALGLDFSLFYFASDQGPPGPDKYRLLLEGARFADENGFQAVWTPERHFAAFGGIYPNPAVAGAALAVLTKNVQIRAGSSVLPLHHPVRVAEEWALVDNLSNGRVGISFASGWHPDDFILRPENFAKNKEVMLRDIDVVRRLWRGERLAFPGPKGEVTIGTLPRPVQSELPIWLTAAGNVETFEAAGRLGAGLLTHLLGQTLEEVREKVAAYRRAWREAGHPGKGHVTLMLHTFVGDDDAAVKETVREPMKGYLKSSIMLIAQHAWTFPAFKRVAKEGASFNENFKNLSPSDMNELLDYSFERYYETAGLFGTPARCLSTLRTVRSAGVDEVACLLDFGIDTDRVLEQLPKLAALRKRVSARPTVAEDDFSVAAQAVRHRVTHLQCTPSMARMLLGNDAARDALGGLECWMLGGEALSDALVADARSATSARLLNMYGPTETTVWSTTDVVSGNKATLGTPIANTTIRILDRHGELTPIGVPGELCIGGAGVTRGYLGRPELTKERFIPDPFGDGSGDRLYRTGDLARFLADGRLEFLGRLDHQVKVRGYRIELGEIESCLGAIEGVREAVVVAREDTPGDVRLVAYLIAQAGTHLEEAALRDRLSAALPDYMVPAHFVTMPAFPLTPNAKVDRKQLPPPALARPRAQDGFKELESDVEQTIAKVWQDVLGVDKIGANDNFFELGGHSLLAVRAHRALREALSVELSITDIFRFPTVRGLGDHLTSAGTSAGGEEHRARAQNRREALARRAELRSGRRN